ncbi:MAG: 3-dehydroquinate synthase [Bacteroidetes bacterium]|jgi:3-dehydroquinate synthase|nr:3-dehydroquinate synthase [Bacteroidota bacterium]
MRTIDIQTDTKSSQILIGESIRQVHTYIPANRKTIIVTDENVYRHYQDQFPQGSVILMGLGEKNKSLQTIEHIFNEFVKHEVDRTTYIVAIGGGIVCDVVGFAASIYMRGLPFGFVSTTLLSQVDASVGGKNGVNFQGYKNMVGVFNQPDFVICDPEMLKTLTDKEFRAGFAEIVKAGAIKNSDFFEYIEEYIPQALQYKPEVMEKMVYHSVLIKSEVVEADEREKGERRKLNFGHTFAHAIEKLTGMLHGEAVSLGMVMASKLSHKLGFLAEKEVNRLKELLVNIQLPITTDIPMQDIFKMMRQDKKKEGETIHLILLEHLGNAIIHPISFKQLEEHLNDLY